MLSSEIQNKVVEAFEVFDHENNKTVDVREVRKNKDSLKNIDDKVSDRDNHQVLGPLPE